MGAAPSTSSPSLLPPDTIVLNYDVQRSNDKNPSGNYNYDFDVLKMEDGDLDMEQPTTSHVEKIKALVALRDKTYQKLGRAKSVSLNEESSLLLERKIRRYDARIETLKDLEDHFQKHRSFFRDDVRSRNAMANSHLMIFAVLQGVLMVAATCVIIFPTNQFDGTTHGFTLMLFLIIILGVAVSLVTLLKLWYNYQSLNDILHDWESRHANAMDASLGTFNSATSQQLLNVQGWKRSWTLDLVLPIVFLAAWSCVLVQMICENE